MCWQHLRDDSGTQYSLPLATDSHNGALDKVSKVFCAQGIRVPQFLHLYLCLPPEIFVIDDQQRRSVKAIIEAIYSMIINVKIEDLHCIMHSF